MDYFTYRWINKVYLFYITYISVDLEHHEIFHAKVGKGGINAHSPPCRKDSSLSEISQIMFKIIIWPKIYIYNNVFSCVSFWRETIGLGWCMAHVYQWDMSYFKSIYDHSC